MAEDEVVDVYDRDITIVSVVQNFHSDNFVPSGLVHKWLAPFLAEMIGPFALVFLGAGAIMLANARSYTEAESLLMIALAHGLAIGLMIAAAGHISGGHYNPAVTIAMFFGGRIGGIKATLYIVAQLCGAVLAALALKVVFDDAIADATNIGLPTINYQDNVDGLIIGRRNGFFIEMILTFFLVYVISGSAVDSRGAHAIAPLAIGLMITADILLAGPLTGAAMNPARWFGPAAVQGEWKDGWLYILAPITGGLLASLVHNYVFIPRDGGSPESRPSEHH